MLHATLCMRVCGYPEFPCSMWWSGIKCDRKANRNEMRADRRGISPRLSTYRRDTRSDKGSFYFPQSRLTFLLYPVTSSREFPERLPRGIPENEFRVALRRCIDLDDRYSPAARKATRGRMKRGTRERDFNFYLRPIKIVYSSSALVPLAWELSAADNIRERRSTHTETSISRAAYRINVVDELA